MSKPNVWTTKKCLKMRAISTKMFKAKVKLKNLAISKLLIKPKLNSQKMSSYIIKKKTWLLKLCLLLAIWAAVVTLLEMKMNRRTPRTRFWLNILILSALKTSLSANLEMLLFLCKETITFSNKSLLILIIEHIINKKDSFE